MEKLSAILVAILVVILVVYLQTLFVVWLAGLFQITITMLQGFGIVAGLGFVSGVFKSTGKI